jgi:hypothetical protein
MLFALPLMNTGLFEANYQQKGSCHHEPLRVPSHVPNGYVMVQQSWQAIESFI